MDFSSQNFYNSQKYKPKRLFARMCSEVRFEGAGPGISLAANAAEIWPCGIIAWQQTYGTGAHVRWLHAKSVIVVVGDDVRSLRPRSNRGWALLLLLLLRMMVMLRPQQRIPIGAHGRLMVIGNHPRLLAHRVLRLIHCAVVLGGGTNEGFDTPRRRIVLLVS